MPKKIILTCLIVTVMIFAFFTTVVVADDLGELQDRKNQLNQQISQANEQVENIQVELTDTLQQIDNLDQKIETYQAEIDEVSKNLEEIQSEIAIVEEKLTNLENNYKIQRETFQNRIIAQYEAAHPWRRDGGHQRRGVRGNLHPEGGVRLERRHPGRPDGHLDDQAEDRPDARSERKPHLHRQRPVAHLGQLQRRGAGHGRHHQRHQRRELPGHLHAHKQLPVEAYFLFVACRIVTNQFFLSDDFAIHKTFKPSDTFIYFFFC